MLSATFPIPAEELPLVEASLVKCPGLQLLGVSAFTLNKRRYYDLFFTYTQESDFYQLGCCVNRALEQLEPHESCH